MSARPPVALVGSAGAAVVLVTVASVVEPGAGVSRLVVLIAEILLAGGAASLLDDAAVALTTVTPVGLWRRRMPRLLAGVALLSTAWVLVLAVLRWQDSLPPVGLATGELGVLCLVALAAAAVLAARGEGEPGGLVAPTVGVLGLGAFLADLVLEAAVLVPWDGSGGAGVRLTWALVGGTAALVIAAAARDPARPASRTWTRVAPGSQIGPETHGPPDP
jgi:hypothetical protein